MKRLHISKLTDVANIKILGKFLALKFFYLEEGLEVSVWQPTAGGGEAGPAPGRGRADSAGRDPVWAAATSHCARGPCTAGVRGLTSDESVVSSARLKTRQGHEAQLLSLSRFLLHASRLRSSAVGHSPHSAGPCTGCSRPYPRVSLS